MYILALKLLFQKLRDEKANPVLHGIMLSRYHWAKNSAYTDDVSVLCYATYNRCEASACKVRVDVRDQDQFRKERRAVISYLNKWYFPARSVLLAWRCYLSPRKVVRSLVGEKFVVGKGKSVVGGDERKPHLKKWNPARICGTTKVEWYGTVSPGVEKGPT